jgi:hypothetical protein
MRPCVTRVMFSESNDGLQIRRPLSRTGSGVPTKMIMKLFFSLTLGISISRLFDSPISLRKAISLAIESSMHICRTIYLYKSPYAF